MTLTGHPLTLVAVLLAVLLPVATLALWTRVRGAGWIRGGQRLLLIGGCQVTALLLAGVLINNSFEFYTSWADLLGTSSGSVVVSGSTLLPTQPPVVARRVAAAFRGQPRVSGGVVLPFTVRGRRSGIVTSMQVFLPREYAMARYARTRFPVVTVMPGYPGSTDMWLHRHLQLPAMMSREVAAHGATPFVAVIVRETVAPPRDTECADVTGGPQVETFLAQDLRDAISNAFRVRTDRAGWSLMGDSTGGYCATKIAMRHPRLYASAVSLSGYYSAIEDSTTGELYGGSTARRDANSPLWRLAHLPAPPIDLLATISRQERTYHETRSLLAEVRPPMHVTSLVAATGGHNPRSWALMLPRAIDWLSHRFGPLGGVRTPVAALPARGAPAAQRS
jgi:enterochelin esterase-like enzyme